jgi:hypothetical protein
MDITHIAKVVGYASGAAAGVWAVFVAFEWVAAKSTRRSISRFLRGEPVAPAEPGLIWVPANERTSDEPEPALAQADTLLDAVFGPKHFSFRCFLTSCAISVFFTTAGLGLIHNDFDSPMLTTVLVMVFIGVMFNALPDYLSLAESRFVVRRMLAGRLKVLWAVGDLVASVLILRVMVYMFTELVSDSGGVWLGSEIFSDSSGKASG